MSQYTELEIAQVEADRWIDKCYKLDKELENEKVKHSKYLWSMIELFNLLYIEAPRLIVNGEEMVQWDKVKIMMEKILELS